MAHNIHGFVGRCTVLREAAVSLEGAVVTPLHLDYGFLAVPELDGAAPFQQAYETFEFLSLALADWAIKQSMCFALAYIETEYWGGKGVQAGIVWRDGIVAIGPEQAVNVINRCLRVLGVQSDSGTDEFDTLGLGIHRRNEDWISAAARTFSLSWSIVNADQPGGKMRDANWRDVQILLGRVKGKVGTVTLDVQQTGTGTKSLQLRADSGNYLITLGEDAGGDHNVRSLWSPDNPSEMVDILGDLWDARSVTSEFGMVIEIFAGFCRTGTVWEEYLK